MTLNIALVGAGGIGMSHALGYIELRKHFDYLRIVAVCDPHIKSAEAVVAGTHGVLYRPPSRSGFAPRIVQGEGNEISGQQLLDLVPEFSLDDVTATLWDGQNRMHSYEMDFHLIDSKMIAIEYMDFAQAVNPLDVASGAVAEFQRDIDLAAGICAS